MAMIARCYSKVNSTSPKPLSLVALEGKQELNRTGGALAFIGAQSLARYFMTVYLIIEILLE